MKYFILLFLLFFNAHVLAQNDKNSIYTEDKTGMLISSQHPEFTLKIKSNPTTGYSWFLREYDPLLIKPMKHYFEPPADKKLMGAPGYEYWTFHVNPPAFSVPHATMVRLVYIRPWEGVEQAKQLVFRIATDE